MKQLAELVPLILFFIAYQMKGTTIELGEWSHTFDGIFSATAVLIIATSLQVLLTWLLTHELEKRLLWLLAAVLIFGGATLIFRDQTFIFWKPTVFNWALALVFGGSHFIGERNLMERTLGHQLQLPHQVWVKLLWLWVGNFTLVGALNLIVAYQFGEDFWVSYKLYSALGFTLLLTIVTALIIAPHMQDEDGAPVADKAASDPLPKTE
ncbi:MAG: inner membrane-spanning protein YciB [Halieaceae bacterium]